MNSGDQPDGEPAPSSTPLLQPASDVSPSVSHPSESLPTTQNPDVSTIPVPDTPEDSEVDTLYVHEECFHISEDQCWKFALAGITGLDKP